MITSQELLDKNAWLEHHAAVWGDGREWADGATLCVCSLARGTGRMKYRQVPVDDAEAIWSAIEKESTAGHDVFISCATLRPGVEKRGGKGDVLGAPALYVDIDIDCGVHSSETLPDAEQAARLVQDMPFEPTLVIHSGGGLHVWFTLSETLTPASNEEHAVLMKRFSQWLRAYGEERGFDIDAGVTADTARILRPAGSLNFKTGQPKQVVIQRRDPFAVTSVAEADALLPPLVERSPKKHKKAATAAGAPSVPPENDTRVGTRLAYELPVSAFLPTLGFVEGPPGRWSCDFTSNPSALGIYGSAGERERVSVFSTTLPKVWSVEDEASLTSWDLLAQVICRGDWKAAARVALAHDLDDEWQSLLEAVQTHVQVAPDGAVDGRDLIADAMRRQPRASSTSTGRERTFADMVASDEPGQVEVSPSLFVRYAPGEARRHGTWTVTYEKVDGVTQRHERRLCDYILWRPAMSTELTVDESGRTRPTSDAPLASATFTVEVVRWDGERVALPGFDAETSVHPAKVLAALNAGVLLPETRSGLESLANCLRVLGHDEQEREVAYTAAGWTYADDSTSIVYLAPAGSVSAQGITHQHDIAPPPGSHRDALTEAQQQFGFPRLPESEEELREAAESVPAFLAVAPNRPEVGMALLGVQFAAPLHASRRTTVTLVARADSGKSLLADACQAFVSGTTPGSSRFPIDIPKSSAVGATLTQAWYRDAAPIADDYRISGNLAADQKSTSILEALVQNAYASGAPVKGTRGGGLRRAPSAICAGIVTAETTPNQMAVVTRTVSIELSPGDVPIEAPAPVDVFIDNYAKTGLARTLMADYIQWLAARIDSTDGGLMALRAEADDQQSLLMRGVTGRSNETVAVLRTGWHFALLWAAERGIEDLLPSAYDVESAFRRLTEANADQHAKRSPGEALVQAISDMVAGGEGYLTSFDGRVPSDPAKFGWKRTDTVAFGGNGWEPVNSRLPMGLLSAGEDAVLITKSGVNAAAKRVGLASLKSEQVADYLRPYVIAGTEYGGQARVSDGFTQNRPRGATFAKGKVAP